MLGAAKTIKVSCWVAAPALLVAESVKAKGEPAVLGGVPPITPVVVLKPAHVGSVPAVTLYVGAGEPVAVTVKLPVWPTVKIAVAALVNAGGCTTNSVAAVEVAEPKTLVTTQRNWSPFVARVAPLTASVAVVAPA